MEDVRIITDMKVVHCKKEKFDVYIGRPSKWGNPYTHLENTSAPYVVDSREDAVRLYEEWIRSQPELMEAAKKELKGKSWVAGALLWLVMETFC